MFAAAGFFIGAVCAVAAADAAGFFITGPRAVFGVGPCTDSETESTPRLPSIWDFHFAAKSAALCVCGFAGMGDGVLATWAPACSGFAYTALPSDGDGDGAGDASKASKEPPGDGDSSGDADAVDPNGDADASTAVPSLQHNANCG
jgi:hypothetical protein